MIKRVIAALAALMLAGVGILLVLNYANAADRRALAGQEAVDVLVAAESIIQGTAAEDLGTALEVQQVPQAYVVPGAVDSVDDLEGRVALAGIEPGQQILRTSFVSPEELRGLGGFELPEEAQGLHQLTIDVPNPRALGGSITAGDTIGVFGTFAVTPPSGWRIDESGALVWDSDTARENAVGPDDAEGGGPDGSDPDGSGPDAAASASDDEITYTDLVLDKVLVVRVEGGHVASTAEDGEGGEPADVIHVTLALEPQDAAHVIHTMETGSVWLTLSPEEAEDADIRAVVPALPGRVVGVVE